MLLNKNQRVITTIGIGLVVLTGLFPPWTRTRRLPSQSYRSENPAGYHFIASPPVPSNTVIDGIRLDTSRLLIQWFVVIVASGFGVLITATQEDPKGKQDG